MSIVYQFNHEIAMAQYAKRVQDNKGKQVDDALFPAGSPMHIYCKYCGELTQILPESYSRKPTVVCDPCVILKDHGLIKPLR